MITRNVLGILENFEDGCEDEFDKPLGIMKSKWSS